ncbi:ubiquinol-cytochrome C chaperone family protein [Novosphingobium sp.]|uniref:ubiquinol-cytochrome C chaperone family protein n=1 Tax=Novosphingobium sp. TaxID=1874826 RepID=UPI003529D5D0
MSFLARLFGPGRDDRATVRPLWHAVVAASREKAWYAEYGIADTLPGRFDAITLVLSLVLLRMEREPALVEPSVRLTELFVDDMDGQLRESGVGDMVVGKHMGRLMSTLGGRLGAYRDALATADDSALSEAITRNVTLVDGLADEGTGPQALVGRVRALAGALDAVPAERLLAGEIPA